jgi:ABC-type nitrate/sulfonate/bicarbonate transport system substrate-binding protein
MKNPTFQTLLLALATSIALPGIAAAQGETVRIALPKTLVFFPVYAAETLELYAQEGVRVEFLELPGPRASQAMVEGRADLSATFAERPISFLREGKPIKNVMTLLKQNPLVLVVRSDVPARDVKALKGLRVASTVAKSGSDLSLRAILRDGGLDLEKDVTIEFAGVNGLIPSLRERKSDAAILPTDFAAQLIHDKIARSLVDPRRGEGPAFVKDMNFTTLQASDAMLKARPDAVGKVVRAVVQAQKRLRDDGPLALRIALQWFPGVDAAVMQAILDADRPTYRPEITEEMMRQVHAGLRGALLPADDPPVPFADVVAVQYRPLWSQ